jgi:hypothetical protein
MPPGACVEAVGSTHVAGFATAVVLDDDPWAWPGPYCLAYSPRTASYACVSLHAAPTETSGEDLTSPSIAETMELVRRRGADVELGIDLVSIHGSRARVVLDTVPEEGVRAEPLDVVREELVRGGFTVPVTARAVLEPEVWVAVGRVELRYSWRLHEGDASFEYHGTVELRCTPEGTVHELVLDHHSGIGGPFAVVSSAPGTTLHAITFEHQDGGEGWVDVRWYSWLVDAARWCP